MVAIGEKANGFGWVCEFIEAQWTCGALPHLKQTKKDTDEPKGDDRQRELPPGGITKLKDGEKKRQGRQQGQQAQPSVPRRKTKRH